jgi:hypothetical protein
MDWRFWVFDPLLKTNSPSAKVSKHWKKLVPKKKVFPKLYFGDLTTKIFVKEKLFSPHIL